MASDIGIAVLLEALVKLFNIYTIYFITDVVSLSAPRVLSWRHQRTEGSHSNPELLGQYVRITSSTTWALTSNYSFWEGGSVVAKGASMHECTIRRGSILTRYGSEA